MDEDIKQLPSIGRCKNCGRTLTDHNSILFEMGPVCRVKLGLKISKPRIKKVNLNIKKPRVNKVKFSDVDDTLPSTNLENWFSGDDKQ